MSQNVSPTSPDTLPSALHSGEDKYMEQKAVEHQVLNHLPKDVGKWLVRIGLMNTLLPNRVPTFWDKIAPFLLFFSAINQ